jgi:uncharacterized membrane protein
MWTLLLLHISSAVVGLLSGFLAMSLRKGSGWHGAAGNIFFVAMLSMSASAAFLSVFHKPNMLNTVVSLLTFYLVATAWWAARNRGGRLGIFDLGAFVFVLAVAVTGLATGFEAANSVRGTRDGMSASIYFVFGSIALVCSVSDLRMFARGSLLGAYRIARHLWRMGSALLIATLSFFPGQARQLPQWLRENELMFVPHVLLVGAMVFWMYRVKRRKRGAGNTVIVSAPQSGDGHPQAAIQLT